MTYKDVLLECQKRTGSTQTKIQKLTHHRTKQAVNNFIRGNHRSIDYFIEILNVMGFKLVVVDMYGEGQIIDEFEEKGLR